MKSKNSPYVKIIPLGGLGEVGKNMAIIESDKDIVIIDAGIGFIKKNEIPGIEIIIPDITYLEEKKHKIKGIIVTHGHEDHIGAIPFILDSFDIPIYAPAMACELLRKKIYRSRTDISPKIFLTKEDNKYKLGDMSFELFPVSHSIPDSYGILINTPCGNIVHSGDFKFDKKPTIGNEYRTNINHLKKILKDEIMVLMSDSTNAEEEGYSISEQEVKKSINSIIKSHNNRIIISTFASQISRNKIISDACIKYNKKLCIVGKSMIDNTKIAKNLGHIKSYEDLIIRQDQINNLNQNNLVILTTGSQGEKQSGLVRIANNNHKNIQIKDGDTVVISASTIPGNEVQVNDAINKLLKLGAKVITDKNHTIHASGHAYKNELKELINTVKPKFFVPVHGELKMQIAHGKIAESENINKENIFILENGEVLLLKDKKLNKNGKVPAENILIDGKNLIYEDDEIIKERNQIYKNGLILVTILFDSKYKLSKIVDLMSYGVIIDDSYENIKYIKDSLEQNINSSIKKQPKNKKNENFIKEYSANFLRQKLDIKSKIIVSLVNND
ncbi:MAG: ribonuclease J [Chloroflexi bacterium]|nr:ribonuclease J [Chloroflexota bacterium]